MGSEQAFHATSQSADADWLTAARSAMTVVTSSLTLAPVGSAIEELGRLRGELDGLESLLLAQRSEAGHSDRSNQNIFTRSGKVSKAEAKRRTRRSNVVRSNPRLAKQLTKGELSTEKVDLLAEADEKTDGAAANDTELIDKLAEQNPDQGKATIRKYIEDNESQDNRDSRYAKQRKNRRVYKTKTPSWMSRLIIEGDDESVDAALQRIRKGADSLYRSDGGRDVPGNRHERTHDQRMFDAAMGQLQGRNDPSPVPATGATSTGATPENANSTGKTRTGTTDGPSAHKPTATPAESQGRRPDGAPPGDSCNPRTGNTLPDGDAPANGDSLHGDPPDAKPDPSPEPPPRNRPGERPTVVLRIDIDPLAESPEQLARWKTELIGGGAIPSCLASYLNCIGDQVVQLTSESGEVLRQGRAQRSVTAAQWIALVARDGGCVQCHAHHSRCEAHHLTPWTSPLRGETNVEDMALLCVDCHHQLHELKLTLYRDGAAWRTRPATPEELPARSAPRANSRRPKQPTKRSTRERPERRPHDRSKSGSRTSSKREKARTDPLW